jgi:phosphoserine aminotransferase
LPEGGIARAGFRFSAAAGPLPDAVLDRVQRELRDWRGDGASVLALPFTSTAFRELAAETVGCLRTLLSIPDSYRVLFMHGGASARPAVPFNLLHGCSTASSWIPATGQEKAIARRDAIAG